MSNIQQKLAEAARQRQQILQKIEKLNANLFWNRFSSFEIRQQQQQELQRLQEQLRQIELQIQQQAAFERQRLVESERLSEIERLAAFERLPAFERLQILQEQQRQQILQKIRERNANLFWNRFQPYQIRQQQQELQRLQEQLRQIELQIQQQRLAIIEQEKPQTVVSANIKETFAPLTFCEWGSDDGPLGTENCWPMLCAELERRIKFWESMPGHFGGNSHLPRLYDLRRGGTCVTSWSPPLPPMTCAELERDINFWEALPRHLGGDYYLPRLYDMRRAGTCVPSRAAAPEQLYIRFW